MAKTTRAEIKGYFETGDIPTESQFIDTWDSYLSLSDADINALTSKTTPVNADIFIVEDSEASYAKKKVTKQNLSTSLTKIPTGGSTGEFLKKTDGTDFNLEWGAATAANGVPSGGAANAVLTKNSATDYDDGWTETESWNSLTLTSGEITNLQTGGNWDANNAYTGTATTSDAFFYADNDYYYQKYGGTWHRNAKTGGSGSGDVSASSNFGTDNVIVRSDGTSKNVQSTGISIDDNDNISGIGSISCVDDISVNNVSADGNPKLSLGATSQEELVIESIYDSGSNTLDYVNISTKTDTATANKGKIVINVDGSEKLEINDDGIDIAGNISVSGTVDGIDIATDVAANTAKVTNATHTGDATGDTALTVVALRGVSLDSTVASPSDGKILVYRSTGSDWVLEDKPAGGSNPAINDVTDITITSATDNEILAYDNGSSTWINQTAAEAGLAAATHSHAASDIDSGTFVDARIAESNITQHESALSITKSQVSDFTRTGVYRTIWIPSAAMTPRETNGATAGSAEAATNDVNYDYYAFDATTEEGVNFTISMPDEWDKSTVKVKFYWDCASSGSGTAVWGVKGGALSDNDAIDTALGTEQTVTDTVLAVGDVHVSAASSALTIAGTPANDDLIFFQVVCKTSGTLAVDAHLLGVKIQYQETTTESSAW